MSGDFDPIVGIDLGTSNSCVALVGGDSVPHVLADDKGRSIIPSVVSFHPNGQVLVGEDAKVRRIIDPRNTVYSVKRILGRPYNAPEVAAVAKISSFAIKEGANQQPLVAVRAGEFAAAEVGAIILDHLRQIAAKRLGGDPRRAVITVPANFNDAQRQATATAGAIAELVVVRVLNEPTAAALAYGHGRRLSQIVAVYDFGGGTFDITILQLRDNVYEVLATAGDTFLGGDDIDNRLVEILAHAFLSQHRVDLKTDETAMQRLRAAGELAKCELSSMDKTIVRVPEIAVGGAGKALDLEFTIPRDGFVQRISDIIDKSFPVCDEALRLAGMATPQIDEVVLVGGTTRIPYLRKRVAQYFSREPRTDVNPDEAVALGASLQGYALQAVLDRRKKATQRGVSQALPPVSAPAHAPPPTPPDARGERTTMVGPVVPPPLPSLPPISPIGRMPPKKVPTAKSTFDDGITEVTRQGVRDPAENTEPEGVPAFQMPTISDAVKQQPTLMAAPAPTLPTMAMPPAPPAPTPAAQAKTLMEELAAAPPMAEAARPVLLDVVPRGLAVATVSGFCEEIIARNAPIPLEQTRAFTTARDGQTSVEVRVCQGESRRLEENTLLGVVQLEGLPPRGRGETRIAVTFEINTDGMLEARAHDEITGQRASVRITLVGSQSPEEVDAARDRLRGLKQA